MPPNLTARRRGTLSKRSRQSQVPLSPQQKLLLLDTWQRSGLPARDFAALVHISHHTLYAWRKKFEELGPAGLMEQPRGRRAGSRLPELTKRTILMLKQSHPDWGCQRISDMLVRGPALPASPSAVARVLHEAGYEMEETPTRAHKAPVRSFERAKPNQLWQTDLFTFMLKRQNRRVYLVAFMDDHSRFVTGYGLHASQSATLVIEVVRAAMAAYGAPEEILTDNGSQYITWRGKSQFTRELEKRGIKQIVARPRRPQTLGKIERFWGSLWRECVETAVFLDLADARQRIGLWIDHYNLQRPHQGIGGLVPADRFFEAAPEVLKTLKQRVAANARELARHGVPKKPFYLTGQVEGKPFSVHREGDRVILHRAGEAREDIDLKRPRHERTDEVPSGKAQEPAPGTSPLDAFAKANEEVEPDGPQPPNDSAEEGGAV
jgi:transposase InsO family protein